MKDGIDFSRGDLEVIEKVLSDASERAGYEVKLDDLVRDWTTFVMRVEIGYPDSIYDYEDDLSTRRILQEVIDALPVDVGEQLASALAYADERFLQATTPLSAEASSKLPNFVYPDVPRIPRNLVGELREYVLAEGIIAD